jgi:hypothetical protein
MYVTTSDALGHMARLGRSEAEIGIGQVNPMVNPARVTCARLDRRLPIFTAIGTNDPVAVIEAACQRAVAMLDNTIAEMTRIRGRIAAGEPPAPPLIADALERSLRTRMLMRVDDPRAWTGRGPRTAEQIIRWLSRIRRTIAGGQLRFLCLSSVLCGPTPCCRPTTWAHARADFLRIGLCRRFWRPRAGIDAATHLEFQAQTIIHEVSHIFYNTEDFGRGPGSAECITQFIADANNSPIDPEFAHQCGGPGP